MSQEAFTKSISFVGVRVSKKYKNGGRSLEELRLGTVNS